MNPLARTARLIRFEDFEFDERTGELRKHGLRVKLQGQPIQVLGMLLERPGELITREDLQKSLWPNDTIVEFEHSINAAINRLREALCDSAEKPRYVETLPRRGYRFIGKVEWAEPSGEMAPVGAVREPPSPDAEMTGQMVGRFRVLEKLGGGGMGVVHRAEDTKLGRAVAIKFLPAELASDKRALDRFEREARAASALDHPNICTIYETGEHAGQPYLVMSSLKGQTLKQRIAVAPVSSPTTGTAMRTSPLQLDEVLPLAIQITDGLAAAHAKGIIHRDIKPGNVFVTESGQAKILDFGLAKLVHQREESISPEQHSVTPVAAKGNIHDSITRTGVAVGTPAYMSPEQVRGEELDTRTDLFSFGATLYEMATGIQPFTGKTSEEVGQAILTHSPTSTGELNHHLPPKLEAIIAKALEKDREKRYQSAADLRADLASVAPIYDRRPDSAVIDRRYRMRRAAIAVAGFVLLGVSALAYWLTRPLPPPRVVRTVQLTNDGERKYGPIVTDGARVYFMEVSGNTRFVLKQISVDGGEAATIQTNYEQKSFVKDISPNHAELLMVDFLGVAFRGVEQGLWILPLPAGAPRPLRDLRGHDGTWSPDGQQLTYAHGSDLFVAKRDGSEARKLATVPGILWRPRWSPDGKRLSISVENPTTHSFALWELSADGTNLRPLLPGRNNPPGDGECCGIWTPDGRYFLFESTRGGTSNVWAMREEGALFRSRSREPVQVTSGPISLFGLGLNPDGRKIFVIGKTERGESVRYDSKTGQFVPYLNGIPALKLAFSQDGQWVVYGTHPEETLWRSRVDGSERVQLTSLPIGWGVVPRWSPDGKTIAFTTGPDTKPPARPYKTYMVPAEGGSPELLVPGDINEADLSNWSPDGNSIMFTRVQVNEFGESKSSAIDILDLRTREVSTVPGSEELHDASWSPNGRYIAAASTHTDSHKLMLFDFTTRKWSELARTSVAFPYWSRDGKSIYFLVWLKEVAIDRVRISDGKLERVVSLSDRPGTFWFSGLASDDSPLFLHDTGTQEIYALDWEAP